MSRGVESQVSRVVGAAYIASCGWAMQVRVTGSNPSPGSPPDEVHRDGGPPSVAVATEGYTCGLAPVSSRRHGLRSAPRETGAIISRVAESGDSCQAGASAR